MKTRASRKNHDISKRKLHVYMKPSERTPYGHEIGRCHGIIYSLSARECVTYGPLVIFLVSVLALCVCGDFFLLIEAVLMRSTTNIK